MSPEVRTLLKEESRKVVRKPVAKVRITWAGSAVDLATAYALQPVNRASIEQQTVKALGIQRRWAFCETDDPSESIARLDENICVMPDRSQYEVEGYGFLVGWWGTNDNLSETDDSPLEKDGHRFAEPQVLQITFGATSVSGFRLHGYLAEDPEYSEWPVDFKITALRSGGYDNDGNKKYEVCKYLDGTPVVVEVSGNSIVNYTASFREEIRDVVMLQFEIMSWSRRGAFVKITAAYDDFTREHSADDIMSMSILEEAEGSVGTLPIGNISCNALDLLLQNIDDTFSIGNTNSVFSGQARSNRRIEPFIGFEIFDGNGALPRIEYVPKGVYWSRDWNVPVHGTTASTSALDRLGLLQEVDYNGIGNINKEEDLAEKSVWEDKSLYVVAEDILKDLRLTYMPDLEFVIDEALKNEDMKIPLAFFKRQSYFDVIKTIAQAAAAYAYMDTSNEEEQAKAYEEHGNTMCVDILRIETLEHLYPADGDILSPEVLAHTEKITLDDIVDQTIQSLRADMVNVVVVPWQAYTLIDGVPKPPEDSEKEYVSKINEDAIREYGRLEHEYPENNLIQSESRARAIAETILKVFSGTQRRGEISVFGDVTSRVGDIWDVPEYQKRGIDNRGVYVITRLNTDYDGSLRQSATCRRIGDVPPPLSPTVTLFITAVSVGGVYIHRFTVSINGVVFTTENGVVRVPNLSPSDYEISITSIWYVSQTVSVTVSIDTNYEFVLEPITVIIETGGADTIIVEMEDAPEVIMEQGG